ncbi:hypothetical protein [Escherichia coli]|uniref:hypothetical protein n=1 Tax=Escherichia coli TaxID=562 RepID=UPI000DA4929D|nr:hypothetical protein [Escherichia coli]SQJ62338.1 Uncharacterised protein [Escherichia coli]SQR04880.1 Uncharacterised protein [Escherichia coli]
MATVLPPDYDLLCVPFSAATEFTDLADHCDRFAETLIECHDPALKMALYGRLRACLAILHPTLNDPIPPHLVDSLTLNDLPTSFPRFESDPEQLCEYCLALIQLLTEQTQGSETEQSLTGLLCELVWFFAEKLKAPRWLHTADGVVFIEDLIEP